MKLDGLRVISSLDFGQALSISKIMFRYKRIDLFLWPNKISLSTNSERPVRSAILPSQGQDVDLERPTITTPRDGNIL
jgi:hypothetical protein